MDVEVECVLLDPYYIDALAASIDATGERVSFVHDANFNVTMAVNDIYNGAQVIERYHYSPYGEVTYLNPDFSVKGTQESDVGNEYLYTGRRLDPKTGLYQYRYRYYHAQLGRFVTRDPIEYAGGMNLYEYVGGMPTAYVDPEGLKGQTKPKPGHGTIWQRIWGTQDDDLNYCLIHGNVITCIGDHAGDEKGKKFKKLPKRITGKIVIGISDVGELVDAMGDGPCIDTLIVNAHGHSSGRCTMGEKGFGAGSLSEEEMESLRERLCDNATIIIATCQNGCPEDDVQANIQKFANHLGVTICICPGGSTHGRALVCTEWTFAKR